MKLDFHPGLQCANKILPRVRSMIRSLKLEPHTAYFTVESYTNAREQGYAIIGSMNGKTKVRRYFYCAFSQARNSDAIVVYLATTARSDVKGVPLFVSHQVFCGNVPTDKVYSSSAHFYPEPDDSHIDKAAQLIAFELELFISPAFKTSKFFFGDEAAIEQKRKSRLTNEY